MSYYPIDTHATVREFEAAGIETKQAEAIVNAMAWSRNDLVTKDDLGGFATKSDLEVLKAGLDSLNAKMERFAMEAYLDKFATKADFERILTKEDLEMLRKDMVVFKADMEKLIDKAFNRIRVYLFIMTVAIIVIVKYL